MWPLVLILNLFRFQCLEPILVASNGIGAKVLFQKLLLLRPSQLRAHTSFGAIIGSFEVLANCISVFDLNVAHFINPPSLRAFIAVQPNLESLTLLRFFAENKIAPLCYYIVLQH